MSVYERATKAVPADEQLEVGVYLVRQESAKWVSAKSSLLLQAMFYVLFADVQHLFDKSC